MTWSHIRLVPDRTRRLAPALGVVALAVAPLLSPVAAGARSVVADSPNPGSEDVLNAVNARSARDLWAVGHYVTASGQKTLVLHWNGTGWKQLASPSPGGNVTLTGVSAVSATDAWAVGYDQVACSTGGARKKTLILHWDGTSWSQVPSPDPGACDDELNGVSADSATDVWAVGSYVTAGEAVKNLILRWNGTRWVTASSPSASGFTNFLNGVSALSPGDAWAVGYKDFNGACYCTVIQHWNGISWSTVKSPNPSTVANQLNGISAVSAKDAWAVGWADIGAATYKSLILHWDGSKWSRIPSPSPSSATCENQLQGVSADSAKDAWAVGPPNCGTTNGPLIVHWNGTAWSQVPAPPAPAPDLALNGASADSATDAWAVGAYQTPSRTLALHWNGAHWVQK